MVIAGRYMCNHAKNDNKVIYKGYIVCVCVCGGGGGDLHVYSRLRSGNTFAFLETENRLVLCHLRIGFQV